MGVVIPVLVPLFVLIVLVVALMLLVVVLVLRVVLVVVLVVVQGRWLWLFSSGGAMCVRGLGRWGVMGACFLYRLSSDTYQTPLPRLQIRTGCVCHHSSMQNMLSLLSVKLHGLAGAGGGRGAFVP